MILLTNASFVNGGKGTFMENMNNTFSLPEALEQGQQLTLFKLAPSGLIEIPHIGSAHIFNRR